ncbi:MAG: hypothetical protein AAF823_15155 [Planctomycetota bacterium]
MQQAKAPLLLFACAALTLAAATTHAVGWDDDDFIIAGNRLAVYDYDFTFKGYLDNFDPVGLDFDHSANLVVSGTVLDDEFVPTQGISVYASNGELVPEAGFLNNDLGRVLDTKVGPDGHYYAGTTLLSSFGDRDVGGLVEFLPDGTTGREFLGRSVSTGGRGGGSGGVDFAVKNHSSVAILPNGTVWSGVGSTHLDVAPNTYVDAFDVQTGEYLETIALDNGQIVATTMRYSSATNTVLMVDNSIGVAFERDLSGAFLRSFDSPVSTSALAITRGPNDDVYLANIESISPAVISRFSSDGVFQESYELDDVRFITNIVWAGNARDRALHIGTLPEPTTLALAATGLALIAHRRAR